MSVKFLYLQNSVGQAPMGALKQLQGYEIHMVQQYETDRLDWGDYHIVMISMFADQIHLDEMRAKISAYLDGGGTLIINGHIARPFLPELGRYQPMPKRGVAELAIHREADHPAFGEMNTARMYKRKGVAGFYGRGSNPAPDGATILHSVGPAHLAVDWIYDRPEGGRIFVHSGIELWMFLISDYGQGPSYLQQFFDWFVDNSAMNKEGAA